MMLSGKDSFWLQLEVCREYQRSRCTRSDGECKFAHPPTNVEVQANGRVTACYDSIKGRCQRESCKYMHPPAHLKDQLLINGRNHLALKNAILHQQQHLQNPFGHLVPAPPPPDATLKAGAPAEPPSPAASAQQANALFQSALAMAAARHQQQFAAAAAAAAALTSNGHANGGPLQDHHLNYNHNHNHNQQLQQHQRQQQKGFDLSSMPQASPAAALAAAFAASTMNPFMSNPFGAPQSYASQYAATAAALAAAAAAASQQQHLNHQLTRNQPSPREGAPAKSATSYSHSRAADGELQQASTRATPPASENAPSPALKRPGGPDGEAEGQPGDELASSCKRARVSSSSSSAASSWPSERDVAPVQTNGSSSASASECDILHSEQSAATATAPGASSLGGGSSAGGSGRESESPAEGEPTKPPQSSAQANGKQPNARHSNDNNDNNGPARPRPLKPEADEEPRLEICREFLRNACRRGELECRFAHPQAHQLRAATRCGHAPPQTNERPYNGADSLALSSPLTSAPPAPQFVTVCKDFLRGKCSRAASKCRYLHPASHLLKSQLAFRALDAADAAAQRRRARSSQAAA